MGPGIPAPDRGYNPAVGEAGGVSGDAVAIDQHGAHAGLREE